MAGMAISVDASLRSGKTSKGTNVESWEVLSTTDIQTGAARSAWTDTYGVSEVLRSKSDSILMMATLCGATVMSGRGPCRRAISRRLPPQRCRVTVTGSPGVTAMQLAANGRFVRAASRAMTSLPLSVPAANTAAAFSSSAARASMPARASGANGSTAFIQSDCGSPNRRASVSVCRDASVPSIKTKTLIERRPSATHRPPQPPRRGRFPATRPGGPAPREQRGSPAPGAAAGASG